MGPKRILNPEQERAVIARYSIGESALAISKTLGVSNQTIHNTLLRHNVPVRPELTKRRLNEDQRRLVVETCMSGSTVPAVAKLFGTSPETVFRILKAARIALQKGRPPSCEVDHSAFDAITPESLYWMGMLFADGCLYYDKYGSPFVVLSLAEKDRSHVEKFRAFLKSTHTIYSNHSPTAKGGPCAYFRVRSKQLVLALSSRGMVKKRTRVPAPELASSPDFWRGCVDGDGWLGASLYYERYLYPYIGLSGQIPLMKTFQSFLVANGLAYLNLDATESGIWKVMTSASTAEAIIKKLYGGAAVGLDRKMARARAIISGDMTRSEPYEEGPGRQKPDDKTLAKLADTVD
jgi:transposase